MGQRVEFAANGHTGQGYFAAPASGSGPAVVVIQEWWGLVPHIEAVTDRFAAAGFVAIAPDLYHGTTSGLRRAVTAPSAAAPNVFASRASRRLSQPTPRAVPARRRPPVVPCQGRFLPPPKLRTDWKWTLK